MSIIRSDIIKMVVDARSRLAFKKPGNEEGFINLRTFEISRNSSSSENSISLDSLGGLIVEKDINSIYSDKEVVSQSVFNEL